MSGSLAEVALSVSSLLAAVLIYETSILKSIPACCLSSRFDFLTTQQPAVSSQMSCHSSVKLHFDMDARFLQKGSHWFSCKWTGTEGCLETRKSIWKHKEAESAEMWSAYSVVCSWDRPNQHGPLNVANQTENVSWGKLIYYVTVTWLTGGSPVIVGGQTRESFTLTV